MEQNRNQEQGREQQANTPDSNRQQQSGRGNEENMEYVNDPDPALTERDLQENNLSVEEADQIEWDSPERSQDK